MVEALVYMYIWDNRWLFGVPYPPQDSFLLWLIAPLTHLYTYLTAADEQAAPEKQLGEQKSSSTIELHIAWTVIYVFITFSQSADHDTIDRRRIITNFRLPDDKKLCGYLKRKESLYQNTAYVIMLVGLAKIAGVYPLTSGVFDEIAGKILKINLFIWIASKFTTLHICQVYCPFALSRFKAWLNDSKTENPIKIADLVGNLGKKDQ